MGLFGIYVFWKEKMVEGIIFGVIVLVSFKGSREVGSYIRCVGGGYNGGRGIGSLCIRLSCLRVKYVFFYFCIRGFGLEGSLFVE